MEKIKKDEERSFVVLKKSLPASIWGEGEAGAEVCRISPGRGRKRGEAGLEVTTGGGIFYKYGPSY